MEGRWKEGKDIVDAVVFFIDATCNLYYLERDMERERGRKR